MNFAMILELLSALTSLVQLGGNWQNVIADVEALIAQVTTNGPVFPTGSTMLQDFEILVKWGAANPTLFTKLVQDLITLASAKKAAAAQAGA